MKLLGSTASDYAHLVYQELPEGGHKLIKDRYGNTIISAMEAMDSEIRVCIVNHRSKVVAVNHVLQVMLESKGFDVPENIIVRSVKNNDSQRINRGAQRDATGVRGAANQ